MLIPFAACLLLLIGQLIGYAFSALTLLAGRQEVY